MKFVVLVIAFFLFEPAVQRQSEDELFNRVVSELQAGSTDKAIASLAEVIRQNPKSADAYLLRGNLRLSAGDTAGALDDVNKAIQVKPKMGQAYNQRAKIRLMAKDIKGAIQDLDQAIASGYDVDSVYTLRGQLRSDQGDTKGALADFDQAMKLNSNNPQTYGSRGRLLLALEDRDRALADLNFLLSWYETDPLRRVETKKPDHPETSVAVASDEQGQDFKVVFDTLTVNAAPGDKEMIPVIAQAYLNRGSINSFRGNIDSAIADFTKSIRLDSKNIWAFYNRANELEKRGDWEAALADISRAIQLDPMNGNFRVEHGVILTMMGKTSEAQVDFEMLLKADRTSWQKRIDERLAEVKKSHQLLRERSQISDLTCQNSLVRSGQKSEIWDLRSSALNLLLKYESQCKLARLKSD